MNKKLITILMSGLMVFSMVACGKTETKEKENGKVKEAEVVIEDKPEEVTVELENDEVIYLRNEDGKAKLLTADGEEIEIVGEVDWDKGGEYKVKFKYGDKEVEKTLFVGSESEIKEQKEKIAKEAEEKAKKEAEEKAAAEEAKKQQEAQEIANNNVQQPVNIPSAPAQTLVQNTQQSAPAQSTQSNVLTADELANQVNQQAQQKADDAYLDELANQIAEDAALKEAANNAKNNTSGFTEADAQKCYCVTMGDVMKLEEVYGMEFAYWCNNNYPDLFNYKDMSLELSETWANR